MDTEFKQPGSGPGVAPGSRAAGHTGTLSVVIPARNEARSIGVVLAGLREVCPHAELIVVDDGSTDGTGNAARAHGARVVEHPYGKGNGAAIKTGARNATGDVIVCMDADGQHHPHDVPKLLAQIAAGYDMAVGARPHDGHASLGRRIANAAYNRLASLVVGHRVDDLTSGFRAVRRERFVEYLYLLPNGFSYPTTITMAFLRSGYSVCWTPIDIGSRDGESHINPLRDGTKFLLIIFRICTLYSPLKIFFPAAILQFVTGLSYYAYTLVTQDRFTNMSALLLTSALSTFLIGLVSEQVTALIFKHDETRR
jgi:glycosyltransferase involved in cell wall biosynthesis